MRLGEEVVSLESKFGDNDHLFNWLDEKGFLRIWQSIRPALKLKSRVPSKDVVQLVCKS